MLLRLHVGIDAVLQSFCFNLYEGAEQAIPDRENIAVISVGQWLGKMVVDLVHLSRDKNIGEQPVNFCRCFDVGVGDLCEQCR